MSGVLKIRECPQTDPLLRTLVTHALIPFSLAALLIALSTCPLSAFPEHNRTSVRGNAIHPVESRKVGFDILQKAQKNIQHDLGLPENTGSKGNPDLGHSYFGWSLLIIASIGFFLLVLILFREEKKIHDFQETGDPLSEATEPPDPSAPERQDPVMLKPIKELHIQDASWREVSDPPSRNGEEALLLANHLDSFLRSIRTNIGSLKEFFKISLYHFAENPDLFHLIADSTGAEFPLFFTPRFLTDGQAARWKESFSPAWNSEPVLKDGEIFSIAFPFFDNIGTMFVLSVSKNGDHDIPVDWYEQFAILIPELQKKLAEYMKLQYIPLTDTRNEEGDLDFRALENRSLEEIRKGRALGNSFTLLFIKLVDTGSSNKGVSLRPQEFFQRFKEKVRGTLRSADSITVLETGALMILLPETDRIESQYVLNRILDLLRDPSLEEQSRKMRLFSNLLEWRPDSREELHDLIQRGMMFDIPKETNPADPASERIRKQNAGPRTM